MGLKYLLDTNVLSEPAKPRPNPQVLKQLERHSGEYVTTVTVWHELNFGVKRMPESKRKRSLVAYLETLENSGLQVLPYEKTAGVWLAQERVRLSRQGIAVAYADGEIAALAVVNRLILVTRNTQDFDQFAGVQTENWFEE